MKPLGTGLGLAVLLLAAAGPAAATVVDFNDGIATDPIDDAYAFLGLTFSNAAWAATNLEGSSPPFALYSLNEPFGSIIPDTARVIGVFATPVDEVSITALDVGERGARIEAYDAEAGGALVGWDDAVGVGSGVGNYVRLVVAAAGIRRFELYQPFDIPGSGDGVQFDDLEFPTIATAAPESGAATSWGRIRSRFR
jgi:hypothetical protein